MTDFFKRIRELPGARKMDQKQLEDYREQMESAVPEIVRIEEEQRLLATETRLIPDGRFQPKETDET